MKHVRLACAVALGSILAACGGSGTDGTGGAGGSAGAPLAPQLVMVMPMAGVLHVEWTSSSPCDFIEAERKDDQHPTFAPAFEVAGDKTSHMDGDAAMNMTYTYRVQCKAGSALSGYSNEMSANPTITSP
ncbi:MAG: hypothetical protein QM820_45120 [Minicystis sp.]